MAQATQLPPYIYTTPNARRAGGAEMLLDRAQAATASARLANGHGLRSDVSLGDMITALLIVQFVGFPAALAFGWLGQRIGPKPGIYIALAVVFLPASPVTGPMLESSRTRTASALRVAVMVPGMLWAAILVATLSRLR